MLLVDKLHYPLAKHKRAQVAYSLENRGETEEEDRRIKELGRSCWPRCNRNRRQWENTHQAISARESQKNPSSHTGCCPDAMLDVVWIHNVVKCLALLELIPH
jgi:hypothetical protein